MGPVEPAHPSDARRHKHTHMNPSLPHFSLSLHLSNCYVKLRGPTFTHAVILTLLYPHPSTTVVHLFTRGLSWSLIEMPEKPALETRNLPDQSVCLSVSMFSCQSICVVIRFWRSSPQWRMMKLFEDRSVGFLILVAWDVQSLTVTALKAAADLYFSFSQSPDDFGWFCVCAAGVSWLLFIIYLHTS